MLEMEPGIPGDGETKDADFEQDLKALVRAVAHACMEDVYAPKVSASLDGQLTEIRETRGRVEAIAAGLEMERKLANSRDSEVERRFGVIEGVIEKARSQIDAQLRSTAKSVTNSAASATEKQGVELSKKLKETQTTLEHAYVRQSNQITQLGAELQRQIVEARRIADLRFWLVLGLIVVLAGVQIYGIFAHRA